jgi:SPP1 gp7 family putative phage head morphogenesis protein
MMQMFKKSNNKGNWTQAELAKYNRKMKLKEQIRSEIKKYKSNFISNYRDDLAGLYKNESLFTQNLLKNTSELGINQEFNRLPTRAIKSEVVDSVTIKGKTMTEYVSRYGNDLAFRIEQELFESVALGENPEKTARRLNEATKKLGYNRVEMTTRSWNNAILNQSNLDVYEQANLEKVRYLATLDVRTCPECSVDHNNVYVIGEQPFLPRHPDCRCAYSPFIESEVTNPARTYEGWLLDGRRSPEQLNKVLSQVKSYTNRGIIRKKEGRHLIGVIGAAMKKVN